VDVGAAGGRPLAAGRDRAGTGVDCRAGRGDRPVRSPASPYALVTQVFGKPSGQFPLGGDFLGRDVLSRLLNGGWLLLVMAVCATALGVASGAVAGVSAAYLRGRSDGIIMRVVDAILSFPQLVFALLLLSLLGPKLWLIVIAVGVSHAPQVARVLRSAALDVSERDFVKAAELQGDAAGQDHAEGDHPQSGQSADGGGGAQADVFDRDHVRARFPGIRAAAAGRELGNDDQREPSGPAPELVGGHRSRGVDRAADDRDEHLYRHRRAGGDRGGPPT
jgi:hypothetical protein